MMEPPETLAFLADEAEDAAGLLRAVGHPARLLIVAALIDGEQGVSDLEDMTGVRQPGLSRELGKLREAGVVKARRQSKAVFYALADARARRVVSALCAAEGAPGRAAAPQSAGQSAPQPPRGDAPASSGASMFARAGWPKTHA